MNEHRVPATTAESEKRTAVRRRAKRGLVAGYIHEISGRHATPATPQPAPELAPQPSAGLSESEATARL
jgi:hypothetical protein